MFRRRRQATPFTRTHSLSFIKSLFPEKNKIKPLLEKFLQFHELSALFGASLRRVFFFASRLPIKPRSLYTSPFNNHTLRPETTTRHKQALYGLTDIFHPPKIAINEPFHKNNNNGGNMRYDKPGYGDPCTWGPVTSHPTIPERIFPITKHGLKNWHSHSANG